MISTHIVGYEKGMKFIATPLAGSFVIEPRIFKDQRGFFTETYNRREFEGQGISYDFVQDNHSYSRGCGVIRGLHFQKPPWTQAKIVRVVKGRIYDIIVDLRRDSATYGQWFGLELSRRDMRMLLVPKGFAHGFCTLTQETVVLYRVDAFYAPQADSGIRWDDPDLAIPWPVKHPVLSDKDLRLPLMREIGALF